MDTSTNLEELKQLAMKFRHERGWDATFTPKDTAISIVLEAAELLEHYQWETYKKEDKAEIAAELADILIFCFHFATLYDFDISTIFKEKLAKAAIKYPVEIFNSDNLSQADYHRIKKAHRQGTQ